MKNKILIILAFLILVIVLSNYITGKNKKNQISSLLNTTTTMVAENNSLPLPEKAENKGDIKIWRDIEHAGNIVKSIEKEPRIITLNKYSREDMCRNYKVNVSFDKVYILKNNVEEKLLHNDIKLLPRDKYIDFALYYYENTSSFQSNILNVLANWFNPEAKASCKYDYVINDADVWKIVFDFSRAQ